MSILHKCNVACQALHKLFLHTLKNGLTIKTQRRGNFGNHLAMLQYRQANRTITKHLTPRILQDQLCVTYYEFPKPSGIITRAPQRTQLMRLSRALKGKRPQTLQNTTKHYKITLLHNNARPNVTASDKTYLGKCDGILSFLTKPINYALENITRDIYSENFYQSLS